MPFALDWSSTLVCRLGFLFRIIKAFFAFALPIQTGFGTKQLAFTDYIYI